MSESSGSRRSAGQLVFSAPAKTLRSLLALSLLVLALFCVPVPSLWAQTPTPVAVPTWRYDLTHSGQNTNETALTPANVNVNTFGKLFSLAVDGLTYAQPVYVPGLTMSDGLVHNVLFVATSHDSVYAFDADSNGGANANPIWHIDLLTPAYGAAAGETTVPWQDNNSPDVGENGVTGTPAINLATNTMYLVATSTLKGVYYSRLHAINLITGAEQANGPALITATVPGTGNGSTGGQLSFDPLIQNQRTALDYYNGYVYFGYAAHGDIGNWHGWLFAYNVTTLQQTAALCLSPNGYGAGIWESGAGLPIDSDGPGGSGRMFLASGNGTFGTVNTPTAELGESVVQFNLANGALTPSDVFVAFNAETLNGMDVDLGSGGVLMVPDQQGTYPHELVQVGKEGRIVVLNRDALGGFAGADAGSNTNALQDISGVLKLPAGAPTTKPPGLWNTPAYWNGNVYLWGNEQWPMMFSMNNGVLSTTPTSQATTVTSNFPTPSFSISSNGTQDGIAWALRNDQFNTDGPAVLYAWDATDLTNLLYESNTNAQRDSAGPANKNAIPFVTNGKVYVATHGQVDVYGLFNGAANAVAPVITPNGGAFSATQSVTLTSTTTTASIYYTLDGSVPTPASTLYAGPISISTDTTVNAIASAPGYVQSGVSSATFTFTDQAPPVTFQPPAGTYNAAQQVTLADTDTAATIYYTTDGSTPTAASNVYAGPITVAGSLTINAIAIDPKMNNSNIATAAYVIQAGGEEINFPNGFSTPTGLTFNGTTAVDDTRLQLTDGNLNEAGSVWWNTPINVQAFTTNFSFQLSSPTPTQMANGFTFTIQNDAPTALGGDSAGLGYQGITKSVAIKFNFYNYENEGGDSTGIYTDGEAPVMPTVDISTSGVILNNGDNINAQITYDGTTLTLTLADPLINKTFTYSWPISIPQFVGGNTAYVGFTGGAGGLSASQKLLSWTYVTQALPPVFSVAAGTYTTVQNVTLTSATPDAVIYYTTNGTNPNGGSTVYAGPIAVGTSETIQAVAISPTVGTSMVESAAYVIQLQTAPGTFSLSGTPPATVMQGGAATSTITVAPSGGFTGNVTLSCGVTSSPAGATGTPNCSVTQPAAISGAGSVTATLTFTTQSTTSPGTYTVTVTGTSASLIETTTVPMLVSSSTVTPSFSLSGTPISANAGTNGTSTITVAPAGGFLGSVVLTCAVTGPAGTSNLPTCSAAQPAAISGSTSVTATLTFATQSTTSPGAYTVTVTGTSGSLIETTTVPMLVSTVTPSFTLSGTPISVNAGTNGTSTITVAPAGGFLGSVVLTCAVTGPAATSNPPTCSAAQPAAISGSTSVTAALTVSTQGATGAGSYTVTVTGTSASLTGMATVAVTVIAAVPPPPTPAFALTGTPVANAVPGTPASSTITITPSGGFAGSVVLACSLTTSPAGASELPTCSVTQPAAISGTSAITTTLTVNTTASPTAAMQNPLRQIFGLGGGTMAALVLFAVPFRRRKWQSMLGLLLLSAAAMVATGCGGVSPGSLTNAGTTAGAYVFTVTGTSGTITQTATVAVTVQ